MAKYAIPEGELNAALAARNAHHMGDRSRVRDILEAAAAWRAENPVVPTDAFLTEMLNRDFFSGENWTDPQVFAFCVEWQRRMRIIPEPEVPEDLLVTQDVDIELANKKIKEAYWRGKAER